MCNLYMIVYTVCVYSLEGIVMYIVHVLVCIQMYILSIETPCFALYCVVYVIRGCVVNGISARTAC